MGVCCSFSSDIDSYRHFVARYVLPIQVQGGEVLWRKDEEAVEMVFVESGSYSFESARMVTPFKRGALVGEVPSLIDSTPSTSTLICLEKGTIYSISKMDLLGFFNTNPGFQLAFVNQRFVE